MTKNNSDKEYFFFLFDAEMSSFGFSSLGWQFIYKVSFSLPSVLFKTSVTLYYFTFLIVRNSVLNLNI